TEKVANFDRGLVNPYHPEYGYSSYVAWQKSRGHTSDTHDFGAAGVKTPSVQVLDESGNPRYKRTKEGNLVPVTTNAGETWAEKVGGQDILGATARIASAERFKEDYDRIGREQGESAQYQWARENAHKYTPNNAQANQWEESMRRSKVKSATRRAEAVKKRNKKK
ncbi:hypothetical protein EBT25_13630, partial [bacterium]|nr:hypothetical protein [bacterium]